MAEEGSVEETEVIAPSEKASLLIDAFETDEESTGEEKKITVNPVVAEVASWYERIRNAMDYRADEVILRAAIERILKRRILLLGGDGKKIAEPLVRELIWARYFPDATVPEAILINVATSIDLHLRLREQILKKHKIRENKLDEWMFHLMSSDLEQILNPNKDEDTMRNFMFQTLRDNVTIVDDTKETRDAQVFIAICKSFANDDLAFLRCHLFRLYFGELTADNLESVANGFMDYFRETERQLSYKFKDRILSYVKNQTPPFFILRDNFIQHKGHIRELVGNYDELKQAVFTACEKRYQGIATKVRRAIVRSVVFILLTKALFALSIEGTYESVIYGGIQWSSMLLNISIPPLLMVIVGMLIRTPGRDNSERIFARIDTILYDDPPKLGNPLTLALKPKNARPILSAIFSLLWLLAFVLSFGILYLILKWLGFNIVNIGVFMFFFTIVSFLAYRISQMAHVYNFQTKEGILVPIIDFLFMPIIRVGRNLTDGIAQLNLLIFIMDFIIETPFKGMFAFFEQWFLYLRTKREELG